MKKEKGNAYKTILWIEDDYYHLRGLFRRIEKKGFLLIPARSYIEAKKILRDRKDFCLIVLDLIIPYSENSLNYPNKENEKAEETNAQITQNGIQILNYIVKDLKLNIPILILSIVRTRKILDKLTKIKNVKIIEKLGITPIVIERIVLDVLKYNEQNDVLTK